jgi:hypothetical protein
METPSAPDPNFPAEDLVKTIDEGIQQSVVNNLVRLADLSILVLGKTAQDPEIENTLSHVRAIVSTTSIFAELFHSASTDTLTRRELDQKLLRWLEVSDKAGFEKLLNGLPDSTKSYVQRFATLDLEAGETLPVDYFKRPMNPVSAAGNEDSCSGDVPESSWDG